MRNQTAGIKSRRAQTSNAGPQHQCSNCKCMRYSPCKCMKKPDLKGEDQSNG